MTATTVEALGAKVAELEAIVRRLSAADQLGSSTVGGESNALDVAEAVGSAVDASTSIPQLQDDLDEHGNAVSDLASTIDETMDELDARLELADTNLAIAREEIEEAQADIDAAFGVRVDGLSEDVTTAVSSAAGAANVAELAQQAALDAAGIANAKGELITQVTAPSGSRANPANLWIDITLDANGKPKNTPNRYNPNTSAWEPITDQKVIDAAAAAVAAQAAADGKPLILFSTVAPNGTAPTGSTWFMVNTVENVVGQWQQTGPPSAPVWTPRAIASDIIANLDVGKLTAGNAAIATLVAQKIAASTASFQTVNVANLFVTSGATMQQAVIDYLFANVVQAKKITAAMIDVTTLNGITLTGTILQTAADGTNRVMMQQRNGVGVIRFVPSTYSATNVNDVSIQPDNLGNAMIIGYGDGGEGARIGLMPRGAAGGPGSNGDQLVNISSARIEARTNLSTTQIIDYATGALIYNGGRLRAPTTSDLSLTSTNHGFQITASDGSNLAMDNNEIMARDGFGGPNSLYLQGEGGSIGLGTVDSTVNLPGILNAALLPSRMAVGSFTQGALANGASNTTAISFPSGRFSRAPVVFAIALNSRYNVAMASSTTTGGGSITVSNWSGAGATASASIWWVAVQMSESNTFG